MKKTKKIPLFPINLVVLPKELFHLHIFESRYKDMVSNCLRKNNEFGIIYSSNDIIEDIGCSVSIEEVLKKYNDGKYDLLCRGNQRFRILNRNKINGLWYGEVNFIDEEYSGIEKKYFNHILDKYLKFIISYDQMVDINSELNKSDSFDFTKNFLLPNEIKQIFLDLENEKERLDFINDALSSIPIKSDKASRGMYN